MLDMQTVRAVTDKAKSIATPEMTDKHIFALLAFEDKSGTKAKFDGQFGAGAADRVLAEVMCPQPAITITADLTDMRSKMQALQDQIASVQRLAESKADPPEEQEIEIASEADDSDANALAFSELTQSVEARFNAMSRMVEDLKTALIAKTEYLEQRVVGVPKPAPVSIARQLRVTQRDVNDNIIAVEIIEKPTVLTFARRSRRPMPQQRRQTRSETKSHPFLLAHPQTERLRAARSRWPRFPMGL